MDAEVPTGRVFRLLFFWIVLGIVLEFLLVPREHHGLLSAVNGNSLFMNADFYYALSGPATFQAQSQQGGKCSSVHILTGGNMNVAYFYFKRVGSS
jgi:hypothetical protein